MILASVRRLRLLPTLYDTVEIPIAVLDDVNVRQRPDAEAIRPWQHRKDIPVREASDSSLHRFPEELGAGEQAASARAIERDADLVVRDDQDGRRGRATGPFSISEFGPRKISGDPDVLSLRSRRLQA